MATTVACARRGAVEMIVGNVFGSNIFNSLAVGGVAGVVGTGQLAEPPIPSIIIMVVVTIVALVVGSARGAFSRVEGVVLLAACPVILLVVR